MSFLLDPIESGINSLLEPLTSSPSATSSADDVVPVQTSTTSANSKITSASKSTSTPSLTASVTAAATTAKSSASSAQARTTASSSSDSDSTTTDDSTQSTSTTDDSSTTSLPTTTTTPTTLSTSTLSSSSSPSSPTSALSTTPPAPSAIPAQPSLTPSQSTSTDPAPQPSDSNSGSGLSTAGIVIASIFAAGLLISIIWLTIRFCPPVRKRIDAWYEKRREERTWRAALDGPAGAGEKGSGSLSSAGTSMTDSTRPFSFFALGRNPQLQGHGDALNADVENRSATQHHQSYTTPTSAEVYTPLSARPNGHGLGLGRVSLLRNTSLLRKAGFDTPPPQLPMPVSVSTPISSTPTTYQHQHQPQHPHSRSSQAQAHALPIPIRAMKPSLSQIKRKPLPADPPRSSTNTSINTNTTIQPENMLPGQRPASHARKTSSRDGSLPRLQIQIPGPPPGLAEIERVSRIGLAVSGSPAGRAVR